MGDLEKLRDAFEVTKLYITGISMGGGLTVLSAVDIIHANLFPTVECMTFGAPRVGNKKWAEHFDASIHDGQMKRYIIRADPIVVLPTCLTLLCNYGHTGMQIVCHKD